METMTMEMTTKKAQPTRPSDLSALEHVALGRSMAKLFDLAGYEEAVAHFRHALELDPDCVSACVGLAETYSYWGFRREVSGLECQSYYDLSLEYASQALRMGPQLAESHRSLSVALRRGSHHDLDRSRAEILAAVDLRGDDAETWHQYWRAFGYDVSDPAIHRALQLDPRLCGAHNDLGAALCGNGRLAEAQARFQQALRLNPRNSLVQYNLAMTLDRQGLTQKAVALLRVARQMLPHDGLLESGWELLGGGMP